MGYAVQVAANASQLPTSQLHSGVNVSPNVIFPNDQYHIDSSFPELEDYSVLEPEVILEEGDTPIILNDAPITGSRQVFINGKLVTLVPYSNNQAASAPTKKIAIAPKLPVPKAVTLVKTPAINDEVACEYCSVKLPKSIYNMHLNMRHKEEMSHRRPDEPEEIQIDSDSDDTQEDKSSDEDYSPSKAKRAKKSKKSPAKTRTPTKIPIMKTKRPLPALIELNPGGDDETDPLDDPLAL